MNGLRQIWVVTLMNLQSIPQRLGASLVIVIGIAGVVAVLISVLAMSVGFQKTAAGSGRAERLRRKVWRSRPASKPQRGS